MLPRSLVGAGVFCAMLALAVEVNTPSTVRGVPTIYGDCDPALGHPCPCEDKHDGNTGVDWCCPRGEGENLVYTCLPSEEICKTHDPVTLQPYQRPCRGRWRTGAVCWYQLGVQQCFQYGKETIITCHSPQNTCSVK